MKTHSISIGVWTMPKVRPLPFGTKGVYVYLLNNQHSHPFGVYYLPYTFAAHETGLELERVQTAMTRLVEADLITYDESNEVVWVKDLLDIQGFLQSKNWQMTTHIVKHLSTLVHSPLVREALEGAAARKFFADADFDRVWDRVSHTLSHTPYIRVESKGKRVKEQKTETTGITEKLARAPDQAPPPKRGTRIRSDWEPSASDLAWAEAKGHGQWIDLPEVTAHFKRHWGTTPGHKGTKLDWSMAWQNWVWKEVKESPEYRRQHRKPLKAMPSKHDPEVQATMARLAAKEQQEDPHRARQRISRV